MIDLGHPLAVSAMSRMGRCDASPLGRFRAAIGKAPVEELLRATVDAAVMRKAVRPSVFEPVIVGSMVQDKAIASAAPTHNPRDPDPRGALKPAIQAGTASPHTTVSAFTR
jgi:hypothetical protein